MESINDDVRSAGRPLPVILALDVSGSMRDNQKIDTLNNAVRSMIDAFKGDRNIPYRLTVVTFGGNDAKVHLPPTDIQSVQWTDLGASGGTPLGAALTLVKSIIEDKAQTPSNALRPVVVLLSDGMPNPGWEKPMQVFVSEGRSAKCDRWTMGIGTGSDEEKLLRQFVKPNQEPDRFFQGAAGQIHKFFQIVTVSTQMYGKSQINPGNLLGGMEPLGGGTIVVNGSSGNRPV
jgi:uncharacterized protein YegL